MKTPHLLACFAATTTAIAVELKTPAVVADEWNRITGEASPPPLPQNPIGLAAAPSPSLPSPPPATAPVPVHHERQHGDLFATPPGQDPDKGFRMAAPDGDKLPPGAKPWVYQGKTYWLIPIASNDGK